MTGTDHVQAIREILDDVRCWSMDPDDDGTTADQIDDVMVRVTMMAAALAEAEARAERHNAYIDLLNARLRAVRRALDTDGAQQDNDPMATRITPLQREAVVRDLIREARDTYADDERELLILWLYEQMPDTDDAGEGA